MIQTLESKISGLKHMLYYLQDFFFFFWYLWMSMPLNSIDILLRVSLDGDFLIVCLFSLYIMSNSFVAPPGSPVHGISQARILEWVAISFSRGSFQSRTQTHISCISYIGRGFFITIATWEAQLFNRLLLWYLISILALLHYDPLPFRKFDSSYNKNGLLILLYDYSLSLKLSNKHLYPKKDLTVFRF